MSQPMIIGGFILKIKTREWRLCVVKQVPELSESSWILFGQNIKKKTTFQLEFKPYQETTLINHLMNMASSDNETHSQIRLILIRESPKVSHIGTLWPLKGLEMYRKEVQTASALFNSLHQDINMLRLSAQIEEESESDHEAHEAPYSKNKHSMLTRSKKQTN